MYSIRIFLIVALGLAAAPALGQVPPIPDRSITPPTGPLNQPKTPTGPTVPPSTVLPKGPFQLAVRPQIALTNPPPVVGRVAALGFQVSNLGAATAVHLFDFRPGCGFEQTPGVSGLPFRIDRDAVERRRRGSSYTTAFDPRAVTRPRRMNDVRGPEGNGIAVSNGTAKFTLQGVPGAEGGFLSIPDEVRAPDQQALFEPNALAVYQRSVANGTNCEPSAFLMVRDPANVWRLLNPDGTFNDTFRADASQQAIRGPVYSPRNRRTVTFGSTFALRDKLGAFMVGPLQSTCKGVSTALGSPEYPVGISESGGDLVFKIRSGPNGTRCLVRMQFTDLPTGATASARFSVTRDGTQCRMGDGSLLNEQLSAFLTMFMVRGAFNLDRSSQMLMPAVKADTGTFQISQTGLLNPYALPNGTERFSWRTSGSPIVGLLFCEPTAVNDHGLQLRLDSVDIDLPDGVSYP